MTERLLIKEYSTWINLLHENQCYLGRCVIKCKRNVIDLFDITKEEEEEFFEIAKNLRDILKQLFKPDLFNYASLGNVNPQLHIHFIPRYKEKRIFEGFEFFDKSWGQNYAPYEDFKISQELMLKISDKIKENLDSSVIKPK